MTIVQFLLNKILQEIAEIRVDCDLKEISRRFWHKGVLNTKLVPGDTFSPYSPHGNPWFGDNGHTNGGIEFCVLHESRNVSRHVNLCWQIILNSIEVETLVFIYLGNSMNFAITSQPYLVFRLGFDIKYFLNTYANTNQKVYNLKFESSFKQDKIENTYIRTH